MGPCEESTPSHFQKPTVGFSTVFREEIVEIGKRKGVALEAQAPSSNLGLVGLALSGGGIRSASFNLGILQSMIQVQGKGQVNVLRLFDYLSTVSGGGYIGSWLTAWMYRRGLVTVEQDLDPQQHRHSAGQRCSEAREIHHLRQFSNYFTPRTGLFSLDLWTAITIYMRNLLLNQLIVLPILMAVLLLPYLILGITRPVSSSSSTFLLTLSVVLAAVFIGLWLLFSGVHRLHLSYETASASRYGPLKRIGVISLLFAGAAILLMFVMALSNPDHLQLRIYEHVLQWLPDKTFSWAGGLVWAGIGVLLVGLAYLSFALTQRWYSRALPYVWTSWASFAFAGLIGGFLFYLFMDIVLRQLHWATEPWHFLTWGPPLGLFVFLFTVALAIAWQVRFTSDLSREWLASFGGRVAVYAICWAALFSLALYGPLLWTVLTDWTKTKTTLIVGWLVTTVLGVLLGKSPSTGSLDTSSWSERATRVLAGLAMVGLFITLATVNHALIGHLAPAPTAPLAALAGPCPTLCLAGVKAPAERPESIAGTTDEPGMPLRFTSMTPEMGIQQRIKDHWTQLKQRSENRALIMVILISCFAVGALMAISVDVNEFSMHAFYRNRLIRSYLGASNKHRHKDPVTGFDPHDDIELKKLLWEDGAQGPYHILNGALNLTAGADLAWQERKASSFIFSPLYCGSKETRFLSTRQFFKGEMSLGTALAISGAALAPNWGYHSSRPIAFFLALFNVRFGWWLGNPRRPKKAAMTQGPSLGPFHMGFMYYFWELVGQTSARTPYVYVSDGGHFDNLGIYELVKRRCRYIVCCDAGADPNYEFEDLGNAIRKIRIDLGVDLEIDLEMLRPKAGRFSRRHHAFGSIRYDMVEAGSFVGTLLYIKASLVGSEPADVLEYAVRHAAFPHEPTTDQFFSEQQMESYRRLGEHIGWEVLRYGQSSLFDDR